MNLAEVVIAFVFWNLVSLTPPAIFSLLLKVLAKAGRAIWSPLRHKTTAHKSWPAGKPGERERDGRRVMSLAQILEIS